MIFALVGNQNCGKTTLFNALTGSNQHVGNFPGVTVDQKMGAIKGAKDSSVVDLPGIYSLRPYTQEEIVSRDFIINQKPDGIINIVDATNIERNLYLTLQLLELRVPMVLALNMMDEVRSNGGTINVKKMSDALGIPVVPISAAKGEGVSELVDQALQVAKSKTLPKVWDFCSDGSPVHRCIHAIVHLIEDHSSRLDLPCRFCATKLIEGGDDMADKLELDSNERDLLDHCIVEMENDTGLDRNAALAEMRYEFIEKVVESSVVKCHESKEHRRSMKLDRVLTGKYTAIPVFIGVMCLVFWLTFNVIGSALSDWLSIGIDKLTGLVDSGLTAYGINPIVHLIEDHSSRLGLPCRFCATKLIEGGDDMADKLELDSNERDLLDHCIVEMENDTGLDRNAALAEMRYEFIEKVVESSVVKCHESKEHRRSMKLDRVLTGKYTAIPVFIGVMCLVFWLTFNVIGSALSDWLSIGIDKLTGLVDSGLTAYGINPVIHSLIIDGIFAGVGSVLSFLPIIVTLFFFLSILEDTGYMARIAFVMDRPLRKIGLSGRSFVPMLIGFGCSVPAIMATRTVSSDRDRKMTIMLTPYMSCSAKIPIYSVFAAAFFPGNGALVMICLYFSGIVLSVLLALILKNTAFRGNPVPFVMELPNYRIPSPKSVALLLWEKAKDFLQRAFTVIFVATIIIWFLQSFDTRINPVEDSADSMLAAIGRFIAPIFKPLGFADWRVATALISGFTAKEAVVSTMSVLLNTSISSLGGALSSLFTPLTAASFLAFTLLYTPCVAAVATIKREMNSTLATIGIVILQCVVAWLVAFGVYQIGSLIA